MKKRNGFVSNSSSSSFIIGLAKIPTNDWKVVSDKFPSNVYTVGDERPWEIKGDNKLVIESFMYSTVDLKVEQGDKVLYLNDVGPDDDSWFMDDPDDWECNYDKIDFDDFDESSQNIAHLINMYNGEYTYGAGRNG